MAHRTVLIVEDDERVRETLHDFVISRHPSVHCVVAATGKEALAFIRDQTALVLMDIGLPDMSGIEATRKIGTLSPGSKVVVVSIHDTAAHRADAADAGAVGYVPKSSFLTELGPLLARLLDDGGIPAA